ncbi:uncharacterized protein LOC102808707 [Saccoglossus kowalevskii]|uniref:Uncharacterized protein LOC102808707 n=1 Tax=Saccoglossus kowalevskii TaxID=10224 RepID=A0ABM0M4E5_SACKO|nr:PREDICTED: uncharacterized protein LOC102808707 [Saccoglossus kowalevskii]
MAEKEEFIEQSELAIAADVEEQYTAPPRGKKRKIEEDAPFKSDSDSESEEESKKVNSGDSSAYVKKQKFEEENLVVASEEEDDSDNEDDDEGEDGDSDEDSDDKDEDDEEDDDDDEVIEGEEDCGEEEGDDVGEDIESDEEGSSEEEEEDVVDEEEEDDDAHECSNDEEEKCPVCLNSFDEQDVGTPESCDHTFCLECILEWSKNVNTCPVDRQIFRSILVRHSYHSDVVRTIAVDDHTQPENEDDDDGDDEPTYCEVCGRCDREDRLLLCDGCDAGYHCECLDPPLRNIPVEEWFCPECATDNTEELAVVISSDEDEIANLLDDQTPDLSLPRLRSQPTRVIARTRISERVRASIQRARERARRQDQNASTSRRGTAADDRLQSSTATAASSSASTPSTSRTPQRKTKPRKRTTTKKRKVKKRRKTTKKRKGKSKKSTTTTTGKTGTKKRRKRRKKRKTTKRKVTRSRKVKTAVPRTVRGRIANRLGLVKPKTGSTVPVVKVQRDRSLDYKRSEIGVSSLLLTGDDSFLDSFVEPTTSTGITRESAGARRVGKVLSRTALSSHRPIARPVRRHGEESAVPAVKAPVVPPVIDVLGGILQGQTLLHMSSSDITISRDGSLKPHMQKESFKKPTSRVNQHIKHDTQDFTIADNKPCDSVDDPSGNEPESTQGHVDSSDNQSSNNNKNINNSIVSNSNWSASTSQNIESCSVLQTHNKDSGDFSISEGTDKCSMHSKDSAEKKTKSSEDELKQSILAGMQAMDNSVQETFEMLNWDTDTVQSKDNHEGMNIQAVFKDVSSGEEEDTGKKELICDKNEFNDKSLKILDNDENDSNANENDSDNANELMSENRVDNIEKQSDTSKNDFDISNELINNSDDQFDNAEKDSKASENELGNSDGELDNYDKESERKENELDHNDRNELCNSDNGLDNDEKDYSAFVMESDEEHSLIMDIRSDVSEQEASNRDETPDPELAFDDENNKNDVENAEDKNIVSLGDVDQHRDDHGSTDNENSDDNAVGNMEEENIVCLSDVDQHRDDHGSTDNENSDDNAVGNMEEENIVSLGDVDQHRDDHGSTDNENSDDNAVGNMEEENIVSLSDVDQHRDDHGSTDNENSDDNAVGNMEEENIVSLSDVDQHRDDHGSTDNENSDDNAVGNMEEENIVSLGDVHQHRDESGSTDNENADDNSVKDVGIENVVGLGDVDLHRNNHKNFDNGADAVENNEEENLVSLGDVDQHRDDYGSTDNENAEGPEDFQMPSDMEDMVAISEVGESSNECQLGEEEEDVLETGGADVNDRVEDPEQKDFEKNAALDGKEEGEMEDDGDVRWVITKTTDVVTGIKETTGDDTEEGEIIETRHDKSRYRGRERTQDSRIVQLNRKRNSESFGADNTIHDADSPNYRQWELSTNPKIPICELPRIPRIKGNASVNRAKSRDSDKNKSKSAKKSKKDKDKPKERKEKKKVDKKKKSGEKSSDKKDKRDKRPRSESSDRFKRRKSDDYSKEKSASWRNDHGDKIYRKVERTERDITISVRNTDRRDKVRRELTPAEKFRERRRDEDRSISRGRQRSRERDRKISKASPLHESPMRSSSLERYRKDRWRGDNRGQESVRYWDEKFKEREWDRYKVQHGDVWRVDRTLMWGEGRREVFFHKEPERLRFETTQDSMRRKSPPLHSDGREERYRRKGNVLKDRRGDVKETEQWKESESKPKLHVEAKLEVKYSLNRKDAKKAEFKTEKNRDHRKGDKEKERPKENIKQDQENKNVETVKVKHRSGKKEKEMKFDNIETKPKGVNMPNVEKRENGVKRTVELEGLKLIEPSEPCEKNVKKQRTSSCSEAADEAGRLDIVNDWLTSHVIAKDVSPMLEQSKSNVKSLPHNNDSKSDDQSSSDAAVKKPKQTSSTDQNQEKKETVYDPFEPTRTPSPLVHANSMTKNVFELPSQTGPQQNVAACVPPLVPSDVNALNFVGVRPPPPHQPLAPRMGLRPNIQQILANTGVPLNLQHIVRMPVPRPGIRPLLNFSGNMSNPLMNQVRLLNLLPALVSQKNQLGNQFMQQRQQQQNADQFRPQQSTNIGSAFVGSYGSVPPQQTSATSILPSHHIVKQTNTLINSPKGKAKMTPPPPTATRPASPPAESIETVDMEIDMSPDSDEGKLEVMPSIEEDVESSAVELYNKGSRERYLQKLQHQERVVEEVKLAIKPFYQKKLIDKNDYKTILRKAVNKICHSKSGVINPVKVRNLVEGYVKKYQGKKLPDQTKMKFSGSCSSSSSNIGTKVKNNSGHHPRTSRTDHR